MPQGNRESGISWPGIGYREYDHVRSGINKIINRITLPAEGCHTRWNPTDLALMKAITIFVIWAIPLLAAALEFASPKGCVCASLAKYIVPCMISMTKPIHYYCFRKEPAPPSAGTDSSPKKQHVAIINTAFTKQLINTKTSLKKRGYLKARTGNLTSTRASTTTMVIAPVRGEDVGVMYIMDYTCPCTDSEHQSCPGGLCTAKAQQSAGDPVIIASEGTLKTYYTPAMTCGEVFTEYWTVAYGAPRTLLSGGTFINSEVLCDVTTPQDDVITNGWFDVKPKLPILIGLGTCLVVADVGMDTKSGSNNPGSPNQTNRRHEKIPCRWFVLCLQLNLVFVQPRDH